MAGVNNQLDRIDAIALFTVSDIIFCKHHIVDDGIGIGPGTKQIIALEKRIMTVSCMRNHQCLHGQRIFLHQIGNAGIGVNNNFIGQPHLAALIAFFGF